MFNEQLLNRGGTGGLHRSGSCGDIESLREHCLPIGRAEPLEDLLCLTAQARQ